MTCDRSYDTFDRKKNDKTFYKNGIFKCLTSLKTEKNKEDKNHKKKHIFFKLKDQMLLIFFSIKYRKFSCFFLDFPHEIDPLKHALFKFF